MKCEIERSKKFALGEEYESLARLGGGTYGDVYKVKNNLDGKIYAIKVIKSDSEKEGIPPSALREMAVMKKMAHPNVCELVDTQFGKGKVELCLEYCKYDLDKLIKLKRDDPKFYTQDFIKNVMYQLLKAVNHLHTHKILHRDLKPMNILVKENRWIVKLTDFGLARVYSIPLRPYTREILTLYYRAPELILGIHSYSIGVDIWSLGCIFGELFITKPMFKGDSEIDQLFKIFQVLGTFNELKLPGYRSYPYFDINFPYWKGCGIEKYMKNNAKVQPDFFAIDLLKKMLHPDPVKRISCQKALEHPYFNDVKCTCVYPSEMDIDS